jgi:hypothetical protein
MEHFATELDFIVLEQSYGFRTKSLRLRYSYCTRTRTRTILYDVATRRMLRTNFFFDYP